MTVLKMNKRWVVAYSASMIWLILGIIVAILLSQVPPTSTSLPAMITGRRDALMAEIDLGIDPFWLSSVSFRLATVGQQPALTCTAGLYVLTNQTCRTLPTVTQEFERNTLLQPPFYLLEGSTFNITLGNNNAIEELINVWYIESTISNCDRIFGDCEQPPKPTYTCQRGQPGETLPVYRVNNSEYYAFCSDQLFSNSFNLKSITYNESAIQQMYTPRAPLSTNENAVTVELSHTNFEFSVIDYCILLYVDRSQCPSSTSARLNIELKRRIDIPLLPFIIGTVLFSIHFVITIIVHSCYRKCHRKNSGPVEIN